MTTIFHKLSCFYAKTNNIFNLKHLYTFETLIMKLFCENHATCLILNWQHQLFQSCLFCRNSQCLVFLAGVSSLCVVLQIKEVVTKYRCWLLEPPHPKWAGLFLKMWCRRLYWERHEGLWGRNLKVCNTARPSAGFWSSFFLYPSLHPSLYFRQCYWAVWQA